VKLINAVQTKQSKQTKTSTQYESLKSYDPLVSPDKSRTNTEGNKYKMLNHSLFVLGV